MTAQSGTGPGLRDRAGPHRIRIDLALLHSAKLDLFTPVSGLSVGRAVRHSSHCQSDRCALLPLPPHNATRLSPISVSLHIEWGPGQLRNGVDSLVPGTTVQT